MSRSSDVFVEDRLFATLDPLTREISLGENYKALLSDTVGFIRKLPHNLVASFRATLEEVMQSDLLLHVVDASHPQWEEQRFVVDEVLSELGANEKPKLYVFNKIDLLDEQSLAGMRERIGNLLPDAVFVSTVWEDGLEPLKRALLAATRKDRKLSEIRISSTEGKLLAEIHRFGEVLEQRSDNGDIVLRARIGEATQGRLERAGATVTLEK
jgi:GTP-binding protein HflX